MTRATALVRAILGALLAGSCSCSLSELGARHGVPPVQTIDGFDVVAHVGLQLVVFILRPDLLFEQLFPEKLLLLQGRLSLRGFLLQRPQLAIQCLAVEPEMSNQ